MSVAVSLLPRLTRLLLAGTTSGMICPTLPRFYTARMLMSLHSAVIVAGIGFFTDSYDIFAVSLLTTMLGIVYYPEAGKLSTSSDSAIKLSTSAGTVIGQLLFGWLADRLGRKKMYGIELIIIIFATFGQALASDSPSVNIVGLIIFWRVLMGVGIGGDYPLSSIITSEFATTKWRGAMMAAVFAMQGIGQLVCALVMLFVTLGFKEALLQSTSTTTCDAWCAVAVDKMWRTLIGFGAVPACIALYYRLTIPETPRYTFDVGRDVEKAADDVKAYMAGKHEGHPDEVARIQAREAAQTQMQIPKASWSDFFRHYSIPKNGLLLLGTAGSWFMLDVACKFFVTCLENTLVTNHNISRLWSFAQQRYHPGCYWLLYQERDQHLPVPLQHRRW